ALNRWRLVYLFEAGLAVGPALWQPALRPSAAVRPRGLLRATLVLGAVCWLIHDAAHGRWRAAAADLLALAGCTWGRARAPGLSALAVLAAVAAAAAQPEAPPSPIIWKRP